MLRTNEEILDSDSENEYEDARSLTPFLRESPIQTTPPSNGSFPTHIVNHSHLLHSLDQVSDIPTPLSICSKTTEQSKPHGIVQTHSTDLAVVNGTLHKWKTKRIESDLSTAPFSSETSDMDTSGNERLFKTDGPVSGQNRTPRNYLKSSHILSSVNHRAPVQHRLINSGSSGDEISPKTRDVKVIPRPPPKPVTLQSGVNKTAQPPPPPKKPMHLVKTSPLSHRVGQESLLISSSKPPSGTSRIKPVKSIAKPKPPVALKPKVDVKPRPSLPNSDLNEVRTLSSTQDQSSPDISACENTSQTSLTTEVRSSASPPTVCLPHPVSRRVPKLSETDCEKNPQSSVPPLVTAKQPVRAKPVSQGTGKASHEMLKSETQDETKNVSLPVKPASTTDDYNGTFKTSSSETQSSQSQSNSPYQSPAIKKRTLPLSKSLAHVCPPGNRQSSLTESVKPVFDSSHSSPILFTAGSKSDMAPPKPPKDLEKRKSRLMSTSDSQTNLLRLKSQSSSVDLPRTNGVESPPPPLPRRSRESLMLVKPLAGDSNNQSLDDKTIPPPVPAHRNSSRLNIFSESSSNSEDKHSVSHAMPELYTERRSNRSKQPLASRRSLPFPAVREDAEPVQKRRSKTPDSVLDSSDAVATDIKRSPQLERLTDLKLKKKLSSARRAPPKPPTHSTPSESTSVTREEQQCSVDGYPLPPSSPPPPAPFKSLAHVTNSHSEPSMFPSVKSSPNLGKDRRSIPNLVSNSVRISPNLSNNRRSVPHLASNSVSSPVIGNIGREKQSIPNLISNNVSHDPPKKIYTRARRDYEEIELLDDWEPESSNKEKIVAEPKKPVHPLRRDYEEIDLFDDSVSDASILPGPSLTASTSVSSSQELISPITMVAVVRQTNSSDFKIDPTAKPQLPLEDLRENWTTSPKLTRRRLTKSFSAKRGQSLICRRSSSGRFKQKVRTLDPNVVRNVRNMFCVLKFRS